MLGDDAALVQLFELQHLLFRFAEDPCLFESGVTRSSVPRTKVHFACFMETEPVHIVEQIDRGFAPEALVTVGNNASPSHPT